MRHVNHLGGVNHISKPVFHNWELTERLGKILSAAFLKIAKIKLFILKSLSMFTKAIAAGTGAHNESR